MLEIRALSEDLQKKAILELNEDPAQIETAIRELRQWVQAQTHMRSRQTDQFLITFLRAAKYNMERARNRLENYYTYRKAMPEIFEDRIVSLPKYRAIVKTGSILYLKQPISADGPRVALLRPNKFDLQQFSVLDVFKLGSMLFDILMQEDDNVVVAGYVFIMDFQHIPKSVLVSFEPIFTRKLTVLANKASPARMKGFHFLNVPPVFEKLYNLVKTVIHPKLRERFYVHSNEAELYKHIPQEILPQEYGGQVDLDILQEKCGKNCKRIRIFF